MNNPWKLATIGMALAGTTALVTGVTTAYLMRPSAADLTLVTTPEARPVLVAAKPAARPPAARAPRPAPAPAAPVDQTAHRPGPVTTASTVPAPLPTVPAASPAPPSTVPTTATPADCATGGDRALRIAKPGLLGSLIGAGVGAAGGAIADGGQGAGKGALIGGVAGAVLGSGYGAYKTKEECGTIFGGAGSPATSRAATPTLSPSERVETPQAAFQPSDRIAIYSVR